MNGEAGLFQSHGHMLCVRRIKIQSEVTPECIWCLKTSAENHRALRKLQEANVRIWDNEESLNFWRDSNLDFVVCWPDVVYWTSFLAVAWSVVLYRRWKSHYIAYPWVKKNINYCVRGGHKPARWPWATSKLTEIRRAGKEINTTRFHWYSKATF